MSFKAYLDNIKEKTGKGPEDFKKAAKKAGILTNDLTATAFISWMAKEYDLGRGHSMAIWKVFKDKKWVEK